MPESRIGQDHRRDQPDTSCDTQQAVRILDAPLSSVDGGQLDQTAGEGLGWENE
ncbi:hypothetical protein [Halorhabdus sp. CUG00001]|uniref:hypothetical protein n=1 Tax=Halorhabdus sp. CUG00001 TaxID=2600297 RepID=UPI00131BC7DF|nr:hypothetical protein [Halorhabdus sp. CUG00001]